VFHDGSVYRSGLVRGAKALLALIWPEVSNSLGAHEHRLPGHREGCHQRPSLSGGPQTIPYINNK